MKTDSRSIAHSPSSTRRHRRGSSPLLTTSSQHSSTPTPAVAREQNAKHGSFTSCMSSFAKTVVCGRGRQRLHLELTSITPQVSPSSEVVKESSISWTWQPLSRTWRIKTNTMRTCSLISKSCLLERLIFKNKTLCSLRFFTQCRVCRVSGPTSSSVLPGYCRASRVSGPKSSSVLPGVV